MTKEKDERMSIETYRRKRHRLHLHNPHKYSEFTPKEYMVMRAALSQNLGRKYNLHLSYESRKGQLVEIFVLK